MAFKCDLTAFSIMSNAIKLRLWKYRISNSIRQNDFTGRLCRQNYYGRQN